MIYIKNLTELDIILLGKTIEPGEYYAIPLSDELLWACDVAVLSAIVAEEVLVSTSNDGNQDITDISKAINTLKGKDVEIDTEGRQITRVAAGKKGWSYYALGVEFETSKLDGLYCKDVSGTNISGVSAKFYNAAGTELTTQETIDTECVKTVVTIAPSYDYEVISGNIKQISAPNTNIRMYVQAGILELGGAYVKTFVDNLNLKFSGTVPVETDGRASKYMMKDIPGVPYQANQFRFTVKHDAGIKHPLVVTIEIFRA